VYYNPGVQTRVAVAPPLAPASKPYPNFPAAYVNRLGGAMDTMGAISIVLESIIVVWYGSWFYAGYWCGVVFILTGVLANVLSRNPRPGLMMATLVTAFISLSFAVAMFGLSLYLFIDLVRWYGYGYYPFAATCMLVKIIVGFIQFFLSISLAVKCSKAICCNSTVSPAQVSASEVRRITVQSSTAHPADIDC